MTETTNKESSTRWWEFYAVRYAMGTVIGAIIFYSLCRANPTLQPLLLETTATEASTSGATASASLDTTRLILLAAYGLVYCYIASAPILVFHAGRFLLKLDIGWGTKLKWITICVFVPALATLIACIWPPTLRVDKLLLSISVFFLALIIWLQVVVVYRTLCHSTELYQFYAKLSARRKTASSDLTDSYRHLREHGNSFFIVFLEVVLAVVLLGASTLTTQLLGTVDAVSWAVICNVTIIVLWVLPAAFVWVIGTVFERRFSEDEAEATCPGDKSPVSDC